MALLDIFTGDPYKQAAAQKQAFLGNLMDQFRGTTGAAQQGGLAALQSGQTGALGALGAGYGQARQDLSSLGPQAIDAIRAALAQGRGDIGGGLGPALAALGTASTGAANAYSPLVLAGGRYGAAADLNRTALENALGLRGAAGSAQSLADFTPTPGYQVNLTQGLEALLRNEQAAGLGPSGNQLRASQQFGAGLASNEFDKYRNALLGREGTLGGLETGALGTAGSGIAQASLAGGTGAANLYSGTGNRLADLESNAGLNIANLLRGQGTSLAGLGTGLAGAESGVYTGVGGQTADLLRALSGQQITGLSQLAGPYASSYDTAAAGQVGGSQNIWNLIGGLGSAAAGGGLFNGIPGLGGLSSYFNRPQARA